MKVLIIYNFDVSQFSVPSKTLDHYKNDLFLLNGIRFKIQNFEGQKAAYVQLNKDIDSLIEFIETELK